MFRLMRYFSIASLLSIIVASVCLSTLYRKIAIDDIVRLGEGGNTEVTQVFANAFDSELQSFLAMAPGLSVEQLRADPQTAKLHRSIRAAVAGTAVIKVKVYTRDGRTVYSSEPRQIGEDKRANHGFQSAMGGTAVTEITQRDHFSAFESVLADRGVLSTYLPLRTRDSDRIDAVFELYQDITPFLDRVNVSQRAVIAGVVAILLALYGVLFLIVRRADRILRRQEADNRTATEEIRSAHGDLTDRTVNLAHAEARKSAILTSALDCIISIDAGGLITEFNPAAERTFGYRRDEALGRALAELIPPEHGATSDEALNRLISPGPSRVLGKRIEVSAQRNGGECFAAELAISDVRVGDDLFFTAYLRDITERKHAESALRESEARNREHADFLQALLDALPMGVSLVDKNLEVAVANQACSRLLDLPEGMLRQGASLESIYRIKAERGEFGPGDPQLIVAERMALARSRTPLAFERVRHDGVALEVRGVPLPDGSILTIYTDITERKLAERALLAARDAAEAGSRAKSAFLAVMSHEIRTPMNAVIGLLELLGLSSLNPEQRDTVATVRDSSKSLLRLIDDVLDFSKIEAGKLELHEESASLAQMFDVAHQTFSGVASQKGIVLLKRFDPRIAPIVVVDRLRLRQIVNNLLSNAIKFTDRGQVELAVKLVERRDHSDVVSICVRDTGVGMDEPALERLFQPFSQADTAIERRYGGTGLGLAICKRLADLMGAKFEVSSASGVGTSFALILVVRRASGAALEDSPPVSVQAVTKPIAGRIAPSVAAAREVGRLVLVVDDHPVNRRMLARQLNILGYAVQTADDGCEALDLVRGGGFGLVVTDCQMPGMDGYQLASAIRAAESGGARLPIVACTANVSKEAFDQCRAVGMDDVLAKPVELATLDRMLDRWLPAGAPAASSTRDFAAVAELAQGDAALERDLLEDFRQANASDLAAAAQSLGAASADEVRRAAHRIKGAARTIGAAALAQAAATLEQAAGAGDWPRMRAAWPVVQHASDRLDERIAAHNNQPVPT